MHKREFLVSQEQRHKKEFPVSQSRGKKEILVSQELRHKRVFLVSQGRGKKRVACERGAEAQKRVPFVPENDARVSDV